MKCEHGISIRQLCKQCIDAILTQDALAQVQEPEIAYIELDASIPVITLTRALASHGLCLHHNAITGKLQIRRSPVQV
jgi:hypothetical protein